MVVVLVCGDVLLVTMFVVLLMFGAEFLWWVGFGMCLVLAIVL